MSLNRFSLAILEREAFLTSADLITIPCICSGERSPPRRLFLASHVNFLLRARDGNEAIDVRELPSNEPVVKISEEKSREVMMAGESLKNELEDLQVAMRRDRD
jgi:hypothetical protein